MLSIYILVVGNVDFDKAAWSYTTGKLVTWRNCIWWQEMHWLSRACVIQIYAMNRPVADFVLLSKSHQLPYMCASSFLLYSHETHRKALLTVKPGRTFHSKNHAAIVLPLVMLLTNHARNKIRRVPSFQQRILVIEMKYLFNVLCQKP